MSKAFYDQALKYHQFPRPGKISVTPTKTLSQSRDLALAYSPGVAAACEAIAANASAASDYTSRANMVAVISNGTAVLGLGNIGPLAAKPVMEGKAVLFKKFAGIDVFDIEIAESDPDKLIDIVTSLEPTFGGINLEDIKAPECFHIERMLKEKMSIPVFHDDQHGTAIVVSAAILNALKLVGKSIEDVKIVTSGAGAAAIACLELLLQLGVRQENVILSDLEGVIYEGRPNLTDPLKLKYAARTNARQLKDSIIGADIFLGLSAGNVLKEDMIMQMAINPIILALANPTPEISPELAKQVRPDAIIATGRSDYPNQINNVLCFPFIFRGALDVGACEINNAMKLACIKALAELVHSPVPDIVVETYPNEKLTFGPDYIIPKPFDPRLLTHLAPPVALAALETGVSTRPLTHNLTTYRRQLTYLVQPSPLAFIQSTDASRESPYLIIESPQSAKDLSFELSAFSDQSWTVFPNPVTADQIVTHLKDMETQLNKPSTVTLLVESASFEAFLTTLSPHTTKPVIHFGHIAEQPLFVSSEATSAEQSLFIVKWMRDALTHLKASTRIGVSRTLAAKLGHERDDIVCMESTLLARTHLMSCSGLVTESEKMATLATSLLSITAPYNHLASIVYFNGMKLVLIGRGVTAAEIFDITSLVQML